MKPLEKSRRHSPAVARGSVPRAKAQVIAAHAEKKIVPLNQRRLSFGSKWDYAPAPEDNKYIPIAPRHELFIGGKFVRPHSGKYFSSLNPATEEKLTEIAAGDATDVDKAVKAARRA
jgi:aldehyde dehydrogenase (NAD+)